MKNIRKIIGVLVFIMVIILLPENVFALTTLDEILEDGKLTIPSVAPTNFGEYYDYISNYIMGMDNVEDAYPSNENADFTQCDITIDYKNGTSEEKENITIVYTGGNAIIKSKIDTFASKIPAYKTFLVRDLEVINYLVNGYNATSVVETRDTMANYSSELKALLNNSNIAISFKTATGMGDDGTLYEAHLGDAVLSYNGTVYAMVGPVGARVEYIIYVEDGTTDLLKAAQERIDNYLGKGKATISAGGTVASLYETPDDMEFEFSEEGLNLDSSLIENYYIITIGDLEKPILIIADSNKMLDPTYLSTDLETDVSISSNDKTIPLDTRVKATKLTTGNEYEKIIQVLNVEDNETFDLTLYSDTLSKSITKLDNGKFLVSIPVPEKFNDKTLIVYYVKEDSTVEEHEVTVKDNYAEFETNHFSIYTLAEKITTVNPTPISNPTTNNPQTVDNIVSSIIMLVISVLGFASLSIIYFKNKRIQ